MIAHDFVLYVECVKCDSGFYIASQWSKCLLHSRYSTHFYPMNWWSDNFEIIFKDWAFLTDTLIISLPALANS